MKKDVINKWVKFSIATLFLLFFVIWTGFWWLLILLPIIYDIYISKKVHWFFWKKKGVEKQTKAVEWIDAIIFAVVAASIIRTFFIEAYTIPTSSMEKSMLTGDYLFVDKISYGPRLPMTPFGVPFTQNTMPVTTETKSYIDWIKFPYRRLAGLGTVQRNDVVVFSFPEGDTVCLKVPNQDYYQLVRQYGRDNVIHDQLVNIQTGQRVRGSFGRIVARPVDRRENYIKRCVAIPGDSLQVIDGVVHVNGKPQEAPSDMQYKYFVVTDGSMINPRIFDDLNISEEDRSSSLMYDPEMLNMIPELKDADPHSVFVYPLSSQSLEKMKALGFVKKVVRMVSPAGFRAPHVFPHDERYCWNEDQFGPLYVPKKGASVALTVENLPLYRRCIEVYEQNQVAVNGDEITINGKRADSYTFKMDYYFMMGDSRHNSADSRFWGFVPEDHIVGKAQFIWYSSDKDKIFPSSLRWDRIFKKVE